MQLFSAPSNPAPAGAEIALIPTPDRQRLRAARWSPPQALGTICIFPGRAEYIEKYFETVRQLLNRGFAVAALDWRGQGGSDRELTDGAKGHIDDFSYYFDDLKIFETLFLNPFCPKPYYALAHSMGAAIVLAQARMRHFPFERQVLTAPMIDIYGPLPKGVSHKLTQFLTWIGFGLATVPLGRKQILKDAIFIGNRLTSDPLRHARTLNIAAHAPKLALGAPTLGWTAAAYSLMKNFTNPDFLREITTPTLILAAGNDRIVSTPAILKAGQTIPTSQTIVLPGARHEILQENDAIRALFWEAFDTFMVCEPKTDDVSNNLDERKTSIKTPGAVLLNSQKPSSSEREQRSKLRIDALL